MFTSHKPSTVNLKVFFAHSSIVSKTHFLLIIQHAWIKTEDAYHSEPLLFMPKRSVWVHGIESINRSIHREYIVDNKTYNIHTERVNVHCHQPSSTVQNCEAAGQQTCHVGQQQICVFQCSCNRYSLHQMMVHWYTILSVNTTQLTMQKCHTILEEIDTNWSPRYVNMNIEHSIS